MKIRLLIFLIILLTGFKANSQQLDSNWAVITSNELYDMVDDGENIWIAGYGLKKINKKTEEVTYINKFNSDFPTTYAYSIAIDSKGNKWIGVNNGIIKYDGKIWEFIDKNLGFPFLSNSSFKVISIVCGYNDDIWIGTDNGWLVYYKNDQWNKIEVGSNGNKINDIFLYKNDVFIASDYGIFEFKESNLTELGKSGCECIVVDKSGVVWGGTYFGLLRYDGKNWYKYDYTNSNIELDVVASICLDSNGILWLAGLVDDIVSFDGTNFKYFSLHKNFKYFTSGNNAKIVYKNDCIIYSSEFGTYLIDNNIKKIATPLSCLSNPVINCLNYENNDTIIFSTEKGCGFLSKNLDYNYYNLQLNITAYQKYNSNILLGTNFQGLFLFNNTDSILEYHGDWDKSVIGNKIFAMEKDNQGNILISALGLSIYDGKKIEKYNLWNSYDNSNWIGSIKVDKSGVIWIGNIDKGLYKYEGNQIYSENPDNDADTLGLVQCFAIDSANNKWLGSASSGLWKYNDTDWINYNTSNSNIECNNINTISISSKQIIWIGTKGEGLIKFDGNEWVKYNTSNSKLANDTINSIVIDKNENLWIGTNDCLNIFNENGLKIANIENKTPIIDAENTLIFPNPTSGKINIQFNKNISNQKISLYSSTGILLNEYETNGQNNLELDLSEYANGLYFLQIGWEFHKVVVWK